MKIKTTLLKKSTLREVWMTCPGCGAWLFRRIPVEAKSGKESCGLCRAEFHWKES